MATQAHPSPSSEAAILSRAIRPEDDALTPETAEGLLQIRLAPDDLERMHELAVKNQDDRLTPDERTELEHYRNVAYLLDLMHSKARRALKKHRTAR